jgi:hypothetical protein
MHETVLCDLLAETKGTVVLFEAVFYVLSWLRLKKKLRIEILGSLAMTDFIHETVLCELLAEAKGTVVLFEAVFYVIS